jgi:hypothetical protein
MRRKQICVVLTMVFLLSMGITSQAAIMKLDIRVNSMILALDTNPYIEAGRTMIPIANVVEALGASEVAWDEATETVVIVHDEKRIQLQINNQTYWVDGEEKQLEVPPVIVDNRTMIPLRVIAEELSIVIKWNNTMNTVEIVKPELNLSKDFIASNQYTYDDVLWLARIVKVEGTGTSYRTRLGIANVVLNRVKSSSFPNSIKSVILDTNYSTQFPPAHKAGFSESVPDVHSWLAAKNALDGSNNVSKCLYFNHRPFSSKSNDFYALIDGEYFYY